MKNYYKSKPNKGYIIVTVTFLIAIVFLISYCAVKNEDIELHKVNNVALVKDITYFDYIDDPYSQRRICFYRIKLEYQFKQELYLRTVELKPEEYESFYSSNLNIGDSINIMHSSINPLNVKLMKQ